MPTVPFGMDDKSQQSHMQPSNPLDWWPEDLLARHPIREVSASGHQLHPPLFSHIVTFPRLEIPLQGVYENQIELNGKIETVCLKPGSALFIPPNCWNYPTWGRKVEVMSLLFGKKQLGVSIVSAKGPTTPQLVANKFAVPSPVNGPVPHILEAMLELHSVKEPAAAFVELSRALIQCVQRLVHESPVPEAENRGQSFFERVCVYLQGNYQNNITRDSVAQLFSVSPNHLSRVFHRHGHMTFIDYLTHVRIARSKFLLCNYNLKLEDIAVRCGIRDAAYFCRVFKRLVKTTPAEYRMRVLQHSAAPEAEKSSVNGRANVV
jgi:AraC-like DNA-binding protein